MKVNSGLVNSNFQRGDNRNMEAYRIGDHVIAADTEEDARLFYKHEVGKDPPPVIEALSVSLEVPAGEGKTATIRDIINKVHRRAQFVAEAGRAL